MLRHQFLRKAVGMHSVDNPDWLNNGSFVRSRGIPVVHSSSPFQ